MNARTLAEAPKASFSSVWQFPGVLDELKRLDELGRSNLVISKALNENFQPALQAVGLLKATGEGSEITRNAVISKRARIGSPKRSPPRRRRSKDRAKTRQASTKKAASNGPSFDPSPLAKVMKPEIEVPISQRVGVEGLVDHQCRWPIGDPQTAEFHFCNGQKVPGTSYCKHHLQRSTQPLVPRQGKRENLPKRTNYQPHRSNQTCASYLALSEV